MSPTAVMAMGGGMLNAAIIATAGFLGYQSSAFVERARCEMFDHNEAGAKTDRRAFLATMGTIFALAGGFNYIKSDLETMPDFLKTEKVVESVATTKPKTPAL